MTSYRVFIAADVVAFMRRLSRREQQAMTRLLEELAEAPGRTGDYFERDSIGRPIQVIIRGRLALCFWADHAVKEVKIVDVRPAGR